MSEMLEVSTDPLVLPASTALEKDNGGRRDPACDADRLVLAYRNHCTISCTLSQTSKLSAAPGHALLDAAAVAHARADVALLAALARCRLVMKRNKKFGYKKIKDEIMRAFSVDCTQDNSKHKEAFKDTLEVSSVRRPDDLCTSTLTSFRASFQNLISQGRVKKVCSSLKLVCRARIERADPWFCPRVHLTRRPKLPSACRTRLTTNTLPRERTKENKVVRLQPAS